MKNRIPVISVIGIMGTTEESAVDPLEDIFEIREKLKKEVCFVTKLNCIAQCSFFRSYKSIEDIKKGQYHGDLFDGNGALTNALT